MAAVGGGAMAGPSRQFKLPKESELRIEVVAESSLRLRLLSGTAEIFGTELPPENWLTFPPRHKFAIFTWNGATIEVNGTSEVEYVADETPMVSYVNVHAVLDGRRALAKASSADGVDSSQVVCFACKPLLSPDEVVAFLGQLIPFGPRQLFVLCVHSAGVSSLLFL